MPKLPEFLVPVSGYLALLCLGFVIFLIVKAVHALGKAKGHEKPRHSPITRDGHDGHHHESGGHGHGHGDDHHANKEKGPLWKSLLGLCVTILVIFVAFWLAWWALQNWGFGQIPGASKEYRRAVTESHGTTSTPPAPQWPDCPTEHIPTYKIPAPPSGGAWSRRVPVPKCHRIRFCDKERDPECNATDFKQSRFEVKCTTPGDATIRGFVRDRDKHSDACWIQSKGPEEFPVDVIAEFDPST